MYLFPRVFIYAVTRVTRGSRGLRPNSEMSVDTFPVAGPPPPPGPQPSPGSPSVWSWGPAATGWQGWGQVGTAMPPSVSSAGRHGPHPALAVLPWTHVCSVSTPIKDLSYSTSSLCSAHLSLGGRSQGFQCCPVITMGTDDSVPSLLWPCHKATITMSLGSERQRGSLDTAQQVACRQPGHG